MTKSILSATCLVLTAGGYVSAQTPTPLSSGVVLLNADDAPAEITEAQQKAHASLQ
jgi:hypothetical protein